MNVHKLWKLFITFVKISPLTFGGGFAMIPHLENEFVKKKQWLDGEDIPDLFAFSQSVPGSIAVNSSIIIGYQIAGRIGAVCALMGIILPTFLIIMTLAILFLGIQDQPMVQAAFLGIRPAIVGLILYAAYKIGRKAILDKKTLLILVGTVGLLLFTPLSPIHLILIGGLLGISLLRFNFYKK
ncbi:chromate transporter [Pontibacillus marinus]|uniref:Chromate transporter n=1 Tax=Pontibacillus marinus BH030004 = DSM 16465 TaxID=1385511 RepID=A0A0A5FYX1_9BACI|nr:chromate transporter [Pontibacillus marinus]KGX83995.1 hypothetical protein N783_19615 [Pontibacillus marinus BH030004 = DSM 16465]